MVEPISIGTYDHVTTFKPFQENVTTYNLEKRLRNLSGTSNNYYPSNLTLTHLGVYLIKLSLITAVSISIAI